MTSRLHGLSRRLSLRARLTLISAIIVAVAVAAVAGAAYVVVSRQLRGQEDASLQAQAPRIHLTQNGSLGFFGPPAANGTGLQSTFSLELVDATGKVLTTNPTLASPGSFDGPAKTGNQVTAYTTLTNGTRVRVLAIPFPINDSQDSLVLIRDISDDDHTLDRLRIFLAVAGGLGVLLAALGGLVVARSGLRPVDRLTEAAEHIAKTEELDVPIEVVGTDELARLALAFNAMTAALASSRVRQQQLVADAGHELRTPLTSMRTNLDLLIRSEASGRVLPPEDRERLLEDLAAQMAELGTLVGELVNLARDDRATEPDVVLDFAEVVHRAADRARLRAGDAQLVEVFTEPWQVLGRAGELERAVVNLMDNAVKFSPAGEPVVASLEHGVLTVVDQGPGINAEDLPHVFDRFYRSTSARGMPGSGLGLAIVAQTVRAHGGTVSLDANPAGGTIATLTLPADLSTPPPPAASLDEDVDTWQRPSVTF